MFNHLKFWNNRGWHWSWRRWPWTILSTNPFNLMLLYWSTIFESVLNSWWWWWKCNKWGTVSPIAPLLHRVSGTGRYTPSWLPSALTMLSPSSQVRLLYQGCTTRHQNSLLQYIEHEASLWFGPDIPPRGWRLVHSKWGLLVGLCQTPVHVTKKASLTRRNIS